MQEEGGQQTPQGQVKSQSSWERAQKKTTPSNTREESGIHSGPDYRNLIEGEGVGSLERPDHPTAETQPP